MLTYDSSLWILLTLCSAFFLASSDALVKKVVAGRNEYSIAWLRLLFTVPPLAISLLFAEAPPLDWKFFAAFLLALPLEIVALVLYVKALKVSPMSITLPFLSFTPLFLILFSYVILSETLTARGILGIAAISLGSYVLNAHSVRQGVLKPLKAIARERGALFMMATAFIYSITSALGKVAVLHSSAVFFGATYFIAVTVCFAALKGRVGDQTSFRSLTWGDRVSIALSGLLYALMVLSHMVAISISKAAYMVALKRSSILMGVIMGVVFFREKRGGERFLGALIMFAGIILIVMSHA